MCVCVLYVYVCIGTIRRFLEHFGEGIDLVVFVTDGQEVSEYATYMELKCSNVASHVRCPFLV